MNTVLGEGHLPRGGGMILQSRRNNYSSAVFAKPENVLPAIFVLSSHVRSVLCSFGATDIEALSYLKLWNDVRISLNSSGRQVCVRGSHKYQSSWWGSNSLRKGVTKLMIQRLTLETWCQLRHLLTVETLVERLFQNYDTTFVRFFATYNCNHFCSVRFFFSEVYVHFLLRRLFNANIR